VTELEELDRRRRARLIASAIDMPPRRVGRVARVLAVVFLSSCGLAAASSIRGCATAAAPCR
jgi:hypothetical protein